MIRTAGFLLLASLQTEGDPEVRRAFQALEESRRFTPEAWAPETPEGRLVLDELTASARTLYRRHRAAGRATLGKALAAAGDSRGAAVELRRSAALDPQPETFRALAALPNLPLAERVDAFLFAWSAGGALPQQELAATGAFPHADSMLAAVERFRLRNAADRLRIPESLTLEGFPFPEWTLAVRGGVHSSARSFSEGRWLLLYQPEAGCLRCGEALEDLQRITRGRGVDVIVAVEDPDLPLAARIAELAGAGFFEPEPQSASARARIGGRPIAHLVRRATLPPRLERDAGSIRIAARSGYLVLRAPLDDDEPPRRALQSVFRLLDDPPFPGGTEPLASPADTPEALIDAIGAFEALGHPTRAFEERLAAAVGRSLPEARAAELLEHASRLRGGALARRRLLEALAPRVGDRLLEAARALDPEILRAAPGGAFAAAVAGDVLGLQVAYERQDGSRALLHAALTPGTSPAALQIASGTAGGVGVHAPGGFQFSHDDCVSWGPASGPLTTHCPASRRDGGVVARVGQLAGEPGRPPFLWRWVDGGPEADDTDGATERLLAGLDAFARSEYETAAAMFESAIPGPGSPVDDAARRYNLAATQALLGDREGARARLEAIGDATFAPLVERAIRDLYRPIRSPPAPGPIR